MNSGYKSPRRHLLQAISLVDDIVDRRRREGQLLSDEEYDSFLKLCKALPLQKHQKPLSPGGNSGLSDDSGHLHPTTGGVQGARATQSFSNEHHPSNLELLYQQQQQEQLQQQKSETPPLICTDPATPKSTRKKSVVIQDSQEQQQKPQSLRSQLSAGAAGSGVFNMSVTEFSQSTTDMIVPPPSEASVNDLSYQAFSESNSLLSPSSSQIQSSSEQSPTTQMLGLTRNTSGTNSGDLSRTGSSLSASASPTKSSAVVAKLRRALGLTSALTLSATLQSTRDDVSSLVNFSVACSALTSSPVKIVQILVNTIGKFTPRGKPVTPMVYDGEYVVDPINCTMIANTTTSASARVQELFRTGNRKLQKQKEMNNPQHQQQDNADFLESTTTANDSTTGGDNNKNSSTSSAPNLAKSSTMGVVAEKQVEEAVDKFIYDEVTSAYYIPISAEGEAFGYISIANIDKPDAIDESKQQIIFAVACVAALALRTSWQLEDMEWSRKKQSQLLKIANSITSDAFSREEDIINRISNKSRDLGEAQMSFFFRLDEIEAEELLLFHNGELHSRPDEETMFGGSGSHHLGGSGHLSSPGSRGGSHHHQVGIRNVEQDLTDVRASTTRRTATSSSSHRAGGGGGGGIFGGGGGLMSDSDEEQQEVWTEEAHLAYLVAEEVLKNSQVVVLQQGPNEEVASFVEKPLRRGSTFGTAGHAVNMQSSPRHGHGRGASVSNKHNVSSGSGGSNQSSAASGPAGAAFVSGTSNRRGARGIQVDLPSFLVRIQSVRSVLGVPVLDEENNVIGVIILCNKNPRRMGRMDVPQVFDQQRDSEIMLQLASLTAFALANSRHAGKLQSEKKKRDAILSVVAHLNECDIRNVDEICKYVMHGAKKLLNADRSTLFLIDEEHDELYSAVADSVGKVIRFPVGKGIAGRVALTGNPESIRDVYQDDRFNREVDKETGYRTLSILTMPVVTGGNVVAVGQLVNKLDNRGKPMQFSLEDQEMLNTFTMFAGIAISNSKLLEFTIKAGQEAMALTNFEAHSDDNTMLGSLQRKQSMGATLPAATILPISVAEMEHIEDALQVLDQLREKNSAKYDPTSIDFDLFALREEAPDGATARDYAAAAVVFLFLQSGFDRLFKVDKDTIICFVLQCKQMYRYVPYHNFFHAVDAVQTIYTFMFPGGGRNFLSELETFVMLVTALVHDLDHMGTNNNYHLKTDSPLGILSAVSGNNSVLEVHHCNVAIQILGGPDCNIFGGLSKEAAPNAYRMMMSCVLATDMARHGELLNQFEGICQEGFDRKKDNHRILAMQMLMKAADISNVTKPFAISRQWSVAVTEEFYQQGDKERAKGLAVLPMNDRQLGTELAKGQIGFINFIAAKFFNSMFSNLFKQMNFAIDRLNENKETWEKLLAAEASEH